MNKIFTFARETSLGRFLIPAGIILVVFGIITMNLSISTENYIRTEATVSRAELLPFYHAFLTEAKYPDYNSDKHIDRSHHQQQR